MKVRSLLALLIAIAIVSCDDTTEGMGIDILPDNDQIHPARIEFPVHTQSIESGPIYSKTDRAYIGKYTDKKFGELKASFLTEFNCIENLKFPDVYNAETGKGTMAGDTVHQTEIVFYYQDFFGDSIAPNRISLYKVNKKIEKNFYTDVDPTLFYSKDDFLASATYNISDPISEVSKDKGKAIKFILDKKIGQKILELNRTHPEYFKDSKSFIENVFKGIYAETDLGSGHILYLDAMELNVVYKAHLKDSLGNILKQKDGQDSLQYYAEKFAATKEVIQANSLTHSEEIQKIINEKEHTYLKSPAGIFTEVTLPFDEINKTLSNETDTVNAISFGVKAYNKIVDSKGYEMGTPDYILMVRKKDEKDFFYENKVADDITSFVAKNSQFGINKFYFANISRLYKSVMQEKEDAEKLAKKENKPWSEKKWREENPDWNKVILIPIQAEYSKDSRGNQVLVSVKHDMRPLYIKLEGGDPQQGGTELKVDVLYSRFK